MKTFLPAHWNTALINGDYSGFASDEEGHKEVEQLLRVEKKLGYCAGVSDEPELKTGFYSRETGETFLAGTFLEYTFWNKSEQMLPPIKDLK